ncbi:hypothetical protein [Virgibacillus sp. Bac332]|uniref:hypothetical protein n=1 Tax=Virgibacillus sp. Bac332 TaxID=2419842 RepID=UPI0013CE9595|nr:hypothetical protein [Virgibacillus sp. Bac332]
MDWLQAQEEKVEIKLILSGFYNMDYVLLRKQNDQQAIMLVEKDKIQIERRRMGVNNE